MHCPKCGQPIRSDERLRNHMDRCLATGRWKEARRARSRTQLRQLEGMSIQELITMIEEFGYSTEALSNDEIYDLAISVLDGHEDEAEEELDFSDD